MKNWWIAPALAGLMAVAACGGEAAPAAEVTEVTPAVEAPAPAAEPAAAAPAAEGNVIEVRMSMAGAKAVFEPASVTAKPGDVLRFVNVDNVHNVSFPAAKNPAGAKLPAASPYLTQPGQTFDVKVELPAGTYTFQCDPHVMMGMVGELKVAE